MSFSLNKQRTSLRYHKRLNPTRDWAVLLVIFMISILASIVSNVWFFGQVTEGGVLGNASAGLTESVSESSLQTVLDVIGVRAVEEEKYVGGVYHFVDPSK